MEVSWSAYTVGGRCCGTPFVNLDGIRIRTHSRFDSQSTAAGIIGNLETFKARVAHNLQIHMPSSCCGSVGAALMIIYDDPAS